MLDSQLKIWTLEELSNHEFPPVSWMIEPILPTGLTVLFGAPKIGKSWLMISIASAVSSGTEILGKIKVESRRVLYLALEDPPRRIKTRIERIQAELTSNCHIATTWERGKNGITLLHKWMESYPDTKLIIIDTWGRFSDNSDGNDYNSTVNAAAELKVFSDAYDIAVLIVHHTRKSKSEDFLNASLGSTGLPATADTSLMISRGRGNREAVLQVTGRDVEEAEYALAFDKNKMSWILLGEKLEIQSSNARQEIYDLLLETPGLTPTRIAEVLDKNLSTVKTLLRKMVTDESLISMSGAYSVCKPVNSIDSVN